jgi:hypothetical protein
MKVCESTTSAAGLDNWTAARLQRVGIRAGQAMQMPPSRLSACPVIMRASSPARYTARGVISSAGDDRGSEVLDYLAAGAKGGVQATVGVVTHQGEIGADADVDAEGRCRPGHHDLAEARRSYFSCSIASVSFCHFLYSSVFFHSS